MKNLITIVILLVILTGTAYGTQWGSRIECPELDNYPQAILDNGDVYVYDSSYSVLYRYPYTGSYTWGAREACSGFSGDLICATISPDGTEGYVFMDDGNTYHITSTDGISWTLGSPISSDWWRDGYYIEQITCGWDDPDRWIYMGYSDGVVMGDNGDYSDPQVIDTGGFSAWITVNASGNYMVVGDCHDLFELTGQENGWSGRTKITEIDGGNEIMPVLGQISSEGHASLIWLGDGSTWRSEGDTVGIDDEENIETASVGRIKAMFK